MESQSVDAKASHLDLALELHQASAQSDAMHQQALLRSYRRRKSAFLTETDHPAPAVSGETAFALEDFLADEDIDIEDVFTPRPSDDGDSDEGSGSDSDSGTDEDDEDDDIPVASITFNQEQLSRIRSCLVDVILPANMARPPPNLGEPSHGKLKASAWFSLFTIFLPMELVELWHGAPEGSREFALLDNFYHLVTCTNIVSSYSTSNEEADSYTEHYIEYRRGLEQLFPGSHSRPNHHWAMHNGPLLKFWGPLMALSEYTLEQKNGLLQRIKTNHHTGKAHSARTPLCH